VPIVQEAGWAPGPVWTGVEKLAPPGIIIIVNNKIKNYIQGNYCN
jgi:hypothetical protein